MASLSTVVGIAITQPGNRLRRVAASQLRVTSHLGLAPAVSVCRRAVSHRVTPTQAKTSHSRSRGAAAQKIT
ncbi:hypothetical protein ElyMa_002043600 [Elysia marginata]|uniref:Uncharacterized protein n=1 Tax=Elysia marginata TaxID=1093978 RepID=A0AAV4F747_9GAST|nr:hypothetical protein ElyMa_002043600 [Elysia marginata]